MSSSYYSFTLSNSSSVLFVLLFRQLTYSTTRYGIYEVVTAELKKTNGKFLLSFFIAFNCNQFPILTATIVDDSFYYHMRLNTNYRALPSTVMQFGYVQIRHDIDNSFCCLNKPMTVHDSFSVSSFSKNRLQPR